MGINCKFCISKWKYSLLHSFAVVKDTVECCGNKRIVCKCRTGNIETINIRHGVGAGDGGEDGTGDGTE